MREARPTYVSLMAAAGTRIEDLPRSMGHASPNMTFKRYRRAAQARAAGSARSLWGNDVLSVAAGALRSERARARASAVLGETTNADCDCTAGIRAKERIENGLADGEPGAR